MQQNINNVNLDTHISELLYRHDCVIVADFGGFVANYRPSFIHPSNHTISPPSKRVAFNSSLTSNDGLLANYVATKLNISYAEAIEVIKQFREDCFNLLNDGEKLNLNKVGVLYLDTEKNIQFIPDATANYSLESYGLSTVQTAIIKPETEDLSIIESFQQKEPNKWWRLLEVVPAAAAIVLLLLNSQSVDTLVNKSLSSFNPMSSYVAPASKVIDTVTETNPYNNFNNGLFSGQKQSAENTLPATETSAAAAATVEPATAVTGNTVTTSVEKSPVKTETTTTETPLVINASASPTYYIIAGCFKVDENAVKFKNDLIAKGYAAEIIGKHNGLNVVSCSALPNATDAQTALEKVQTELDNGAWIMKK